MEHWEAIRNVLISPLSQPISPLHLTASSFRRFCPLAMALKQSEHLKIFALLYMKHHKIVTIRHVYFFLVIPLWRVKHVETRIVSELVNIIRCLAAIFSITIIFMIMLLEKVEHGFVFLATLYRHLPIVLNVLLLQEICGENCASCVEIEYISTNLMSLENI